MLNYNTELQLDLILTVFLYIYLFFLYRNLVYYVVICLVSTADSLKALLHPS